MLGSANSQSTSFLRTHGSFVATVRVPDDGFGDASTASPHEVQLVVREVDLDTCAVYLDGRKCGWVHRDGHYFVALAGDIPERAHDCGHALLWDEAAAMLLAAS